MTPPPLRVTVPDVLLASDVWGFNCGPAALCAVLGMTPDEIRPRLLDFEQRGCMNPTLMAGVLAELGVPMKRTYEYTRPCVPMAQTPHYPRHGVMRIQFGGPWMTPGVPAGARYQHTHWVAVHGVPRMVYDVNAADVGWMSWDAWLLDVVPWLIREGHKRGDGRWWVTHCWEVDGRATDALSARGEQNGPDARVV